MARLKKSLILGSSTQRHFARTESVLARHVQFLPSCEWSPPTCRNKTTSSSALRVFSSTSPIVEAWPFANLNTVNPVTLRQRRVIGVFCHHGLRSYVVMENSVLVSSSDFHDSLIFLHHHHPSRRSRASCGRAATALQTSTYPVERAALLVSDTLVASRWCLLASFHCYSCLPQNKDGNSISEIGRCLRHAMDIGGSGFCPNGFASITPGDVIVMDSSTNAF